MTRTEARDAAFKVLFEYEFQGGTPAELLALYYSCIGEAGAQTEYFEDVVTRTITNVSEIDGCISPHLRSRSIGRISKVSLAALRIAVCEILYREDVPEGIAVNEAVELTKIYDSPESGSFVNGVLSSVIKEKKHE